MAIKQLRVNVELFFLQAVNNLLDKIVNDSKDISKDLPGPNVGIATNDHEDLKNDDNESEMIETAMNIMQVQNSLTHMISKENGWFSQI